MECPTLDNWAALASGRVTDAELDQLVAHLDSCTTCESLMKRWQPSQESFLPPLGALEAAPDEQLVARLCDRLVAADVTNAGGDASSVRDVTGATLQSFGAYELRELLGRGGMGEVYKAWHRHLHRFVAIKFLSLHRHADDQMQRRFAREMAVIAAVDNPHVVRALDAGVTDGRQYLVMEFIDGEDAATLLRRSRQLSIADAAEIARQAALGLEAVRQAGLVHRDIKPSNIFVTRAGVAKLLDLGLARAIESEEGESDLTASRQVLGTLDYISPEQIEQRAEIDIRADIYSLGCTLYHLLAGRAPFADQKGYAKLSAHGSLAPPPLRELRKEVPAELARLVDAMLAKSPEQRIATPAEVAQRLAPFAATSELAPLVATASRIVEPAPRRQQRGQNSVKLRWVTAVAAAVLVAVSLAMWRAVAAGIGGVTDNDTAQIPIPPGGSLTVVPPNDDGSSGSSSVPADEIPRELAWFHLLRKKPTELLWPHGVGASGWTFSAEQELVSFRANDHGALIFGRADRPYYVLQMKFEQNRWPGGMGIFFGLHDKAGSELPVQRCQSILFNTASDKPLEMKLQRRQTHVTQLPAGRQVSSGPLAEAPIPFPRGEQQLEIEVRANRLFAVRLNGVAIDGLTNADVQRQFTPEDHQGQFGLWAHGADGSVSDACLKLLPDEDQ